MSADPYPTQQVWITLADGARLAGRLWLPKEAAHKPVPVVLEWIPYRQSDKTAVDDAMMHGWFAAHGVAGLRVDLRGSGNSDGTLQDEYLAGEQDDACEVIAWAADQSWSNGRVGMIGISWGGFAALQVAARRPPALKAIITCCSTDDRYRDDVHYMGGALLNDGLSWGAGLFTQIGRPPDPAHVGPRWRTMWQERLEAAVPPLATWLAHPERDDYWTHGSVCEDYAAIDCAVYAVSGWTDGYSDPVLRLMENLSVPRKGLIGAWTHMYPTWAKPGPKIGFLQECMRWWRQWLLEEETGIMDEPMLRLWQGERLVPHPQNPSVEGRWIGLDAWPMAAPETVLHLSDGRLQDKAMSAPPLTLRSPQHCGLYAGEWCPLDGGGDGPEFQADNRYDDALSLCFDTAVLDAPVAVVGMAQLTLDIAMPEPRALLALRLCEVAPDGTSARVTFGLHRLRRPEGVAVGERFTLTLPLKGVAYAFSPGHRIRLALSTSYWPMAWPEPGDGGVTLWTETASLRLPGLPSATREDLPAFEAPASAAPLPATQRAPGEISRQVIWDAASGETREETRSTRAEVALGSLVMGGGSTQIYTIGPEDGASAVARFTGSQNFAGPGWAAAVETVSEVRREGRDFVLFSELRGREAGEIVFERRWWHRFPG